MTKDLQSAKKIIQKHKMQKVVSPKGLVLTANQLNKSLTATLNTIAFLKSGGRGYGPFPQTAKVLTGEYS